MSTPRTDINTVILKYEKIKKHADAIAYLEANGWTEDEFLEEWLGDVNDELNFSED